MRKRERVRERGGGREREREREGGRERERCLLCPRTKESSTAPGAISKKSFKWKERGGRSVAHPFALTKPLIPYSADAEGTRTHYRAPEWSRKFLGMIMFMYVRAR